jgi:NAD(P)-dependent dehydrogenase (short-subunit alcohol dehydrogenase family)
MLIENRTFLVTGAASGLGAATARMLIENGGNVVLVDLVQTCGEAAARELGPRARFVAADIKSEDDGRAVIEAVRETFGTLHGLVNCAGILIGERILKREAMHGLDSFARVVGVNLIGTFNMMRLAAEIMASGEPDVGGERGVIVNTASIAAFDGQIGQAAYAASKGGVASLTLPAARELAAHGIRVVTIAPGLFATAMVEKLSPELQATLASGVPFPSRFGQPAEYAALIRHIIENRMINGEVIRFDGALRMAPK